MKEDLTAKIDAEYEKFLEECKLNDKIVEYEMKTKSQEQFATEMKEDYKKFGFKFVEDNNGN